MKHISALKNTTRSILLAGLMSGVTGLAQAQLGGPGQVGGMGEQGAPAGEYPGQGSALAQFPPSPPKQEGVLSVPQNNPAPRAGRPDEKGSSSDDSSTGSSDSAEQGGQGEQGGQESGSSQDSGTLQGADPAATSLGVR